MFPDSDERLYESMSDHRSLCGELHEQQANIL